MRAGAWLFGGAVVVCGASCMSSPPGNGSVATVLDGGGGGDAGPVVVSVDGGAPFRGSVRMAVPAYFAPGPDWQRLIAGAPTVGMIVFNPDSGPGLTADSGYAAVLAAAEAAHIIVLGYVATNYGQRAEADVTADINRYYDLYKPSGIYLAEGPVDADCAAMEAMYHRLADAVHARDARAYLAIGTRYCPTYITFFDLMVQFARGWAEYQTSYSPPSWMPANSPERFCHFIDAVPATDVSAALSRAIGNGAGWVFVTSGTDPNPWGALPSYFDQELAALRALQ